MAGGIRITAPTTLTENPVSSSVTQDLVTQRFALSQDYANTTFETALNYLGQFDGVTASFDWPPPDDISVTPPTGLSGLNPIVPTIAPINEITVSGVEFPYPVPVMEDHDITALSIPDFAVTLPNFYIPDAPDSQIPVFLHEAPTALTINLPSADEIPDIPPLPILKEILPPDEPEFLLPVFEAVMPVTDLTTPDLVFSWNEAAYDSDIFSALQNKVLDGILNGGQGMLPEVEQAIYDYGRTRQDIELQEATLLVSSEFSSKGSRLPQGAMIARLESTRLKVQLARNDLNQTIIDKSSDMAYQYSTFIIDKGINLEHEFMTLFNNTQQRAFEAAKLLVDFAIQEYDIRVKAYLAHLDGYKTEAEIFKAKISVEIARAEIYKATIDGRKISLEMQGLVVDLYGKQLDAIDTMAKIYATKMDGAKVQSEINMVQIEQYKALVDSYKAQIDAVTAEYNLYQAQITGESEKAKMYSYQVEGYKSTVDAYKTRSDIDINILRAKIEKGQGEINIFTSLIDKYKAEIQNAAVEAEIQAQAEGLKIQVFDGEIKKFTSIVAAMIDSFKTETSVDIANADVQIRYGEILAKIEAAEMEIQAELIKAKALVASQLSSSALSSVSAGANLGYSQNRSDNQGTSYTYGDSTSDSYSLINKNCCGE